MTVDQNLEAVKEAGTKTVENLTKLLDLNMKVFETLTTRNTETMNRIAEQIKRQLELATQAKDFKDLKEVMKGQVELAKETNQLMLEESKTNVQTAAELREQYTTLAKESMDFLSNKVREVTPNM